MLRRLLGVWLLVSAILRDAGDQRAKSCLVACVEGNNAGASDAARAEVPRTLNVKDLFVDDDDDEYELELELESDSSFKPAQESPLVYGEVEASLDGSLHVSPASTSMQRIARSTFNYGRGIGYSTTEAIAKGDIVFAIPSTAVMSLETARQGRIGLLMQVNPHLSPSICLALHLLEEQNRHQDSPFFRLIQSLEQASPLNSTIFFTDAQLAQLEGSQLLRHTQSRKQAIQTYYDALLGPLTSQAIGVPLFTPEQFTLERFHWAMSTVWSRAFPLSADESSAVIAPILDSIDVCKQRPCSPLRLEWDTESRQLVAYATRSYRAGEQVVVDLAIKSSAVMMLNYGFTLAEPVKSAESMEISIHLDPNDALLNLKQQILESHGMHINGTYLLRYDATELGLDMVQSLKTKLLTGTELEHYPELYSTDKHEPSPIVSLRNEYVFARSLTLACTSLLNQYPTTLDDTRMQLDAAMKASDERQIHILRALLIEKEILHHTLQLVQDQWVALLTTDLPALGMT